MGKPCSQVISQSLIELSVYFVIDKKVVVVVLGFYIPPTAKVIRRQDLGLKSHPKDWRSPGSIEKMLSLNFLNMMTHELALDNTERHVLLSQTQVSLGNCPV